jgi:hypothetical protein
VRLATTAAADRSFTKWLHPLSVGLSRFKRFEREYHLADLAAEGVLNGSPREPQSTAAQYS